MILKIETTEEKEVTIPIVHLPAPVNNFAYLDAQNEMSRLTQVKSNEVDFPPFQCKMHDTRWNSF